jgi:ATP-dependent DNA helicase RecQ
VLAITRRGVAVMKGEERPELPLPSLVPEPAPASPREEAMPSPPDPELLVRLKAWRRAEAARRAVPAYVVFHDRTLAALATARPCDRRALERIEGIGPRKIADYGDAVLEILRQH